MFWSVLIVSLYLFLLLKLILLRILSSLFLSLSLSFFSILFILITVDRLQIWSKLCFNFDSVDARALLVVRWTDTPADGCFWTLLLLLFYCCVLMFFVFNCCFTSVSSLFVANADVFVSNAYACVTLILTAVNITFCFVAWV